MSPKIQILCQAVGRDRNVSLNNHRGQSGAVQSIQSG